MEQIPENKTAKRRKLIAGAFLIILVVAIVAGAYYTTLPIPTSPTSSPTQGLSSTPTPPSTPTSTPAPVIWSDSRIGIVINKVERFDNMPSYVPESFPGSMLPGASAESWSPTLAKGEDCVAVSLTIANIENVHVVSPSYGSESVVLYDTENESHAVTFAIFQGEGGDIFHVYGNQVIVYTNETNNHEALAPGAALLIFKFPKTENPTKLTFVYSFKVTWEEESERKGQLDITL